MYFQFRQIKPAKTKCDEEHYDQMIDACVVARKQSSKTVQNSSNLAVEFLKDK